MARKSTRRAAKADLRKTSRGRAIPPPLSRREMATIKAALRFHMDENLQGGGPIPDRIVKRIATDGGRLRPLDFAEVAELLARLNVGSMPRRKRPPL